MCGSFDQTSEVIKPVIYFLIDTSGSMNNGRLEEVKEALDQISQSTSFLDTFYVGITAFSGCDEITEILPTDTYSIAEFQASYQDITPGGGTATGTAIQSLLWNQSLEVVNDPHQSSRDRRIILITDGSPSSECQDSGGLNAMDYTEDRIVHAYQDQDTPTYIVGFEGGVDEANMERLAEAGGVDNQRDPHRSWYLIDENQQTSLTLALDEIITSVISCELSFTPQRGQDLDRIRVTVAQDGVLTEIGEDPLNGWSLSSLTRGGSVALTLHGAACRDLSGSRSNTTIQIQVACEEGCEPTPERCDYIDNDCDGQIDEHSGCHLCLSEVCDGLIDNDCDGQIDEGCLTLSQPEVCEGQLDEDQDGQIDEGCDVLCRVGGSPEVCEGQFDEDCDGQIDEGCCQSSVVLTPEICDGLDNDGNGKIDEGC